MMTLKQELQKLKEDMADEDDLKRRRGPTQIAGQRELADYGGLGDEHPFQVVGPMGGRNPKVPIR